MRIAQAKERPNPLTSRLFKKTTIQMEDNAMSTTPYDDVLNQAKGLTTEEKEKLIDELAHSTNSNGNGKTVGECLETRGLRGVVADGPEDLSTNPKHMEGFGQDSGNTT